MAFKDLILGNAQGATPAIDSGLAGTPARPRVAVPGREPQMDAATATAPAGTEAQHQTQNTTVAPPAQPKLSYTDLLQKLNPYHAETDEERKAREKREKREGVFSAIGDGISALANLYYVGQYAPDMTPDATMSARAKARWDKLRAEREANKRAYYEAYMRAMQLDRAEARDERAWNHTLEREKVADRWREAQETRADAKEKRAEAKADQEELMFQLRYLLQMGKLTEQGYRNAIAEVKAGKIEALTDAQIASYNRRGTGGGRSSGGGSQKTSVWMAVDKGGKAHSFNASSAANAHSIAGANGWTITGAVETTETSEEKNFGGTKKKKKSVKNSRTASAGGNGSGKKNRLGL